MGEETKPNKRDILRGGDNVNKIEIKNLAICEKDLIELGCERGLFVNHVLNSMLREVNNGRVNNTREDLEQLLVDMY